MRVGAAGNFFNGEIFNQEKARATNAGRNETDMTSSKQILLRIKELNTVRLFAGVDDNRKILGGVHIEADTDTALLVATDGRAMAVMVARLEEPNDEPFKVTLPGDAVDSIARQCGKEAAEGFFAKIDEAVEANREREE